MNITELFAYIKLQRIIRFLQSPKGCEWDRKQTPMSLRAHLREEVEELIVEIERYSRDNHPTNETGTNGDDGQHRPECQGRQQKRQKEQKTRHKQQECQDNIENLIAELGDVLLVVNLIVNSFKQKRSINMNRIYKRLRRKLIFRHPHIFRRKQYANSDAHKQGGGDDHRGHWERMKKLEK